MNYIKILLELQKLKRNEKKSAKALASLQKQKLSKLLHYAYAHSPYYRKSFEQAGINPGNIDTMPLPAFPCLSKQVLLAQFNSIVTAPGLKQEELRRYDEQEKPSGKPFQGKYHIVHSSGSTGKPGYFAYDKAAWRTMLVGIIRGALWSMTMPQILKFLLRGPRIVYIAATDGRYGGAMAVGDGIRGVGAKQIFLDIKTPLEEWVERIKKFKPNMIIGYPSAVKILAQLMEQGAVDLSIRRVVSCGEPLGTGLRKYLEEIFRADVINFYGASESLSLGVEADANEGMVLFDDLNIVEVENGVMYLTCLYNFAQPLIRYRLSDCLALEPPDRDSRRPFTKAIGLQGRDEDMLWFTDKDGRREFLHPLALEGFCVEGLRDYQFRQLSPDAFEMLAEIDDRASGTAIRDEMLKRMNSLLAEKKLGYVRFDIRFVHEILPDPGTGKKRLILTETEDAA